MRVSVCECVCVCVCMCVCVKCINPSDNIIAEYPGQRRKTMMTVEQVSGSKKKESKR